MADRVQERSRRNYEVSGGEGTSSEEENELKLVGGQSLKLAEEVSDDWIDSDSESKAEREKSQMSGTVRINRVSTRTLDEAKRALANFSGPTSTATSATTSTNARPPAEPPSRGHARAQDDASPVPPVRHRMPDSGKSGGNRDTPQSPTKPRFVGDKPKTPAPSTGSSQPAPSPRPQASAPGTPRSGQADVSDRNVEIAITMAKSISARKGAKARLRDFESVLSQAGAIPSALRGKVLLALTRSLNSLPDDSKGACLAELRELAVDMPPEFRKTFLQQLLEQLTSNHDSSSERSSDGDVVDDAEQFEDQYDRRESRCSVVGKLVKKEIDGESLQQLASRIKKTGISNIDRGVIETVIAGLADLDPEGQDKVIGLFADAGISFADVLGALLHTPHGEEVAKVAKSSGRSLSALYSGALTGNHVSIQNLLLILGKTALPAPLHVYLAEGIGEFRRNPVPAPTAAVAVRAVLLEIISLSTMSEAKRWLLLHAASEVAADKMHDALKDGDLNDAGDYWAYAHQVIASVIDIGSCYQLVDDTDQGFDLACYAARATPLLKDISLKVIVDQKKCTWDAPRLRALMLGRTDPKDVKRALANVLESNLSPTVKLALLMAESAPVGDSVESHVRQMRYEEAVKQYKKKHPLLAVDNSLAYEVVKDDERKYDDAYKTLTRKLDPDALGEIKGAATRAMIAAQHSRLPAMHVAAVLSKTDVVRAYMEAVVEFRDRFPEKEKEIVPCLDLRCKGRSLLYTAMIEGTDVVVDACVSTILASKLLPKYKTGLINARREPDKLGAFYVAMSSGRKETALMMVHRVLASKQLDNKTKVLLLQCPKPVAARKAGSDTPAGKALEKAAGTARAEAERMRHDELLSDFDRKVERSELPLSDKQRLQTS